MRSFAVFVVVFCLLVAGVHYYLWQRLIQAPKLDGRWRRIGTYALVALGLLTPMGMFSARWLPRAPAMIMSAVVFTWVGLAALLGTALLLAEPLRTLAHAASALLAKPLDAGRRLFLSRSIAGAAGVMAFGAAGVGAASALGAVAVQPVRVRLKRLPEALAGFRIVQLTDVHIGPMIGGEWLAGIVEKVNALRPDIVVITGDLVDGSVDDLREHVAPLAKLSARYGVYLVTGNHEYYSGAESWLEELGRLGIRVLHNERVSIGDGRASFDLAGVDDWTGGQFVAGHGPNLSKALVERDATRELVLLAHQPKQIHEAAKHGVGLQISGHTHGGQFFPGTVLVHLQQPYVAGLAQHGDTQIYVSRGTGYWGPPMRVGAPAEITVIELFPRGEA